VTTATGDFAYDFTGDQDPFSAANWSKESTGEARIVSGNYRNQGGGTGVYTAHTYTGTTYSTSGDVAVKIEVNGCGSGDDCRAMIVDGTGAGYVLDVKVSIVSVDHTTNYGISGNTNVGYSNANTFSAGEVYSLTLTRGSPNTVVMKKGVTTITPNVGTNTHTATLGSTLYAGVAVLPDNIGNNLIGSMAADGIASPLTPIVMKLKL
jgi:hypothetical protein